MKALDNISLNIPSGSFTCLLGPSGCGKTTLLRIIAGLETTVEGTIILNGKDITSLPTHERGFGVVFQSLALFPHLSIFDNIAYGLRTKKTPKSEQDERVKELLQLVKLPGFENRLVHQLSGGQKQRVAIARALAFKPNLFLLDEPLSALDAKLREEMQIELKEIQQKLGITTILVTHDQREAMSMGDLMVVMKDGIVKQVGQPGQVYRKPNDSFVAEFLGTTNLFSCSAKANKAWLKGNTEPFSVSTKNLDGNDLMLFIRAEDVDILSSNKSDIENTILGSISFIRDLGNQIEIIVTTSVGICKVLASSKKREQLKIGERIKLRFPSDSCGLVSNG